MKCDGLFFDHEVKGACPAGGIHKAGLLNYTLAFNRPGALGQRRWAYCRKCQGLGLSIFRGGCPSGGIHDYFNSGEYRLLTVRTFSPPNESLVPLFHAFHPGLNDHLYTTDVNEHNRAITKLGYQPMGVACFVYPVTDQPPSGTVGVGEMPPANTIVPLWRLFKPQPPPQAEEDSDVLSFFTDSIAGVIIGVALAIFFGTAPAPHCEMESEGTLRCTKG